LLFLKRDKKVGTKRHLSKKKYASTSLAFLGESFRPTSGFVICKVVLVHLSSSWCLMLDALMRNAQKHNKTNVPKNKLKQRRVVFFFRFQGCFKKTNQKKERLKTPPKKNDVPILFIFEVFR
jgi:hypothetical protein